MSERRIDDRNSGYTLIELLISIVLTGVLIATISLATTTVLRSRNSTVGRANNARSEQAVGLWMPADLASAESVDTTAGAVPCGPSPACPAGNFLDGSNAVNLTWSGSEVDGSGNAVASTTAVSYRVVQSGTEYILVRVECLTIGAGNPACTSKVVLHGLESPPSGVTFVPGVTSPSWVITVNNALAANDTTGPGGSVPAVDPGLKNKNGQRVVVTINGGGSAPGGGGGGQNQITLSAGGTDRALNLSTSDLTGAPTFTAARSRCGGNFAMLVDTSGSIGSTNMNTVKGGINGFIDTFAGTPIKLEVVRFSGTASALLPSGSTEWVHYYDMLVDSDVAALKALVGPSNNSGLGLISNGGTNWEDGVFHLLKNSDGTVQSSPPDTIIFFTDGVPTFSRIDGTAATAPVVPDPADAGLPPSNGYVLSMIGWNRTERLIRDRGKVKMVGVFVGSKTSTSLWNTAGPGSHIVYSMGSNVLFQRGYHAGAQVGDALAFTRGYHSTYDRNNNVTFQIASSGVVYEQLIGITWMPISRSAFTTGNTTPDESDKFRLRVTGTPGTWQTMTSTQYDKANIVAGSSDGFRTTYSTLSPSWTSITAAVYNLSNTTADTSDGYRTTNIYSTPYDSWEPSTLSAYLAGNTTNTSTDGWQATTTGTSTVWTSVTTAQFNASNTTTDESDGWRPNTYAAPYSTWENVAQAAYDASNTVAGSTDGWQTVVSGSATSWTPVTLAAYTLSNTTANDGLDGWQAVKTYSAPYDTFDALTSKSILDYVTLGNVLVDATSGDKGPFVEATLTGGHYTNAAVADLFVLPDYTQFSSALSDVALGQCGGTVTMQTRLVAGTPAQDPFTYQISSTNSIVQTSAAYRSGTFDVPLKGGLAQTVTIAPQDFTNLVRYSPASWTCKAAGAAYPFTVAPIAGHAPWTSIQLTVNPNKAVSCIQNVNFS
jgi:prepilin-type N-terminal cleavage/methylation domain-containing protein